jgi:hypothetical protein
VGERGPLLEDDLPGIEQDFMTVPVNDFDLFFRKIGKDRDSLATASTM